MQKKDLILVVDDNPVNLRLLVQCLRNDYNLMVAKDGQSALAIAIEHRPDIILLDIVLPDINGFDVCKQLQANKTTHAIPVIFISQMEKPEQKNQAFLSGGVDYITKPVHELEVLARVKNHLLLKKMREQLEQQNNRVSHALDERNRQFNTLMAHLPGIVYQSDASAERVMLFMSVGTKNLTGHAPEYFIGENAALYLDIVVEEDKEKLCSVIAHAVATHTPFDHVYRIIPKKGEPRWVLEQGIALYNEKGSPIGIEGFICDVTESKKQELGIREENLLLKRKMKAIYFGNIVGTSEPMQEVYRMILKAASSEGTVIIYGESGTGKELVARAIHDQSKRFDKRYVPVNCGAIPEHLFESEFFGYKKGAFTGATEARKGILAQAQGGTLFLDELGEISLSGQVKLLRAIDGGGFNPVGGGEAIYELPRIIAATNSNLFEMMQQGKMRSDFFYRIHVFPIYLPPLRERKDDILDLINHFLKFIPDQEKKYPLTRKIVSEFVACDWPGNVRELQNAVYQYVTLGIKPTIGYMQPQSVVKEDPFVAIGGGGAHGQHQNLSLCEARERFEQEYVEQVLAACAWRKAKAADILKIDRRTLFRKMQQYNLQNRPK